MFVKPCTIYKVFLNEDETQYLRDVCIEALSSEDEVVQYTASQIAKKVFAENSCKLKIPQGMVKRYNGMIKETAPGMAGLLCISLEDE